MNPYRIAHMFMAAWPLYVLALVGGGITFAVGWKAALFVLSIVAMCFGVAILIVAWESVMHWLDGKAREHARQKQSSGRDA